MACMEVDGGYAWLIAVCGMALQALCASSFSVFSLVYVPMLEHFDATKAQTSLVGAILFFAFGISALCSGPLIRRYGRRRVAMFTPLFVTSGFVLTSFCTAIWQVYITMGVLTGIGFPVYASVAVSTVFRWFDKKQSLALGIVMLGPAVGVVIWPLLMDAMISTYAWRGALIIAGGVNLHALVLFAFMRPPYRPRPPPMSPCNGPKQDTPDKDPGCIEMELMSGDPLETPQEIPGSEFGYKRVLAFLVLCKDPSFLCFVFAELFIYIGHVIPYTYTTPRAILLGHSATKSALLSSIVGISSMIGRTGAGVVGYWLSRFSRIYICALAVFLTGLVSVISIVSDEYWFLVVMAALTGMTSGIYAVYIFGGPPDLFGKLFASELTGINLFFVGVSTFISNVLTGWLMDTTGNPSLPFAVTGAVQTIGALCMLASVVIKRKQGCH